MKPITILGAGLSGLTAAITLAKAGYQVHVYEERSDRGCDFMVIFKVLKTGVPLKTYSKK